MLSHGKLMNLERSALKCLQPGKRISFLELFSGKGMLTLGVRSLGLKALDGLDSLYTTGLAIHDGTDWTSRTANIKRAL